jgi:hypothetical protein
VSDGSHRSLRCSLEAAVFVGSDETIVSKNSSVFEAFRRLVLQSGRREHRGRRIALGGRLLRRLSGTKDVRRFWIEYRGQRNLNLYLRCSNYR